MLARLFLGLGALLGIHAELRLVQQGNAVPQGARIQLRNAPLPEWVGRGFQGLDLKDRHGRHGGIGRGQIAKLLKGSHFLTASPTSGVP